MAGEIYLNNLTGKFEWGSIVDQIIRLKSIPIQRLSKEAEGIQLKQASLSKLSDAVRVLKELFSNLEPASITEGKKAISSDEKVLTASAKDNTPEINLKIKVEQLAQKEIMLSRFSTNDINANINWNDFSLRFAKNYGDYVTFNIQAGSGKLSDLVNRINQTAGDYIQASVYFDGNNYRLMLTEKNEALSKLETDTQTHTFVISEASAMNINGVWGLDYTAPLQFAKNAKIGVGDNYQPPSKEVVTLTRGVNDPSTIISWDSSIVAYFTGSNYLYANVSAGYGTIYDMAGAFNNAFSANGIPLYAKVVLYRDRYTIFIEETDLNASNAETVFDPNYGWYRTVVSFADFPYVNGELWDVDRTDVISFAKNQRGNLLESPSNTFENVIDGLTVTVKSLGEAKVEVQQDFSKATNTLKDFVEKYNKVIEVVNQLTAKDAIFQGDYGIFGIKGQLTKTLDGMFAYDILNINEEGKIELNSSALSSLIQNDSEKFKQILEDLKKDMLPYLSGLASSLERFNQDYSSRIERINARMDYLKTQLIREEERLRLEYAKVEAFMNRAQEIMARLQAFIVSLSEMQGGNRK